MSGPVGGAVSGWGMAGQVLALFIILLVCLHWLGKQTQRLVDWWVERQAQRIWRERSRAMRERMAEAHPRARRYRL